MTNSANARIGVGLIGASAGRGWGGTAHVPALQALDAFQIRAVSTTRMESANATARRLGADLAFDTHEALVVRPEVDLVVVAVKVPEHKQIVSDALAAGKMVYCEWPLARNLSEAAVLEGRARERRLRTVVGLQGGLHPPIRFLRDLIAQGVIGTPLSTSIRAHLTDAMWVGRYDPPVEYMAHAKHGATLLSIMVGHGLEPLARVLGTFESLSAVVANQRGDGVRLSDGTSLPKDAPDEIVVAGVLESGIVTSLHYSAGQSAGSATVWEIQGTEGSVRVESASGYIHFTDLTITLRRGSEPVHVLQVPPAYAAPDLRLDAPAAGVARLYAQFAADLRDGTADAPDFAAALDRHRVLEAITRAAGQGHRQRLSRPDRMNPDL
ncbi:Gfo/Idh/MocA family protein [Pseudonocardia alni]|uniref:Gfo/Idh/MocA family protein n=1 Tax=Pseudonocardia alni TaxID=33907 RepID=UPI001AD6CDF6|nr:Gfo/Idh/MocA family oxidoreductase [Pseudonocardia alni]MBO4239228.1 Gfo/Idh/MocA family oxidoreductase [Pseudonocardia alni]